jgi:hypothetical protein
MIRRRTLLAGLTASAAAVLPRAGWTRADAPISTPPLVAGDETIRFDVRGAGLKPQVKGPVAKWGAEGPGGKLTANTCYLERDGQPLPIVAGEVHPQRLPVEEWEPAIVQMKAAGLNMISSYIFWNQIERTRGTFDFSGRNDLHTFFGLCRKHGMMAMLRIGPFTNAEFLLGGLPVWLYGLPTTERSNDALYLDLVGRYYAALGQQLGDMMWSKGGPIAMVQIENELSVAPNEWNRPFLYGAPVDGHTGPTGEAFTQHYRNLHRLAVTGGLRTAFYSVTAWGAKDPYPIELVMPTFGGYMDLSPVGPENSELTTFGFSAAEYEDKVPVGFIEIGYGSPIRDSFRPTPPADSGYSSTMTLFGASRSLMVGYYVFRGGSNPVNGDSGWTTKNVMFPLISYDFFAPISEYGEWRDAFYRARPFNHFVRDYASQLARAEPRAPQHPVTGAQEDRARAEARISEGRGFVFVNNYGNVKPLSPRKAFAIELATDRGPVRMPHKDTIELPSGAMAIWPVNLELGAGATLRSATVQPVYRFTARGERWHVFMQTAAMPAELVIERAGVRDLRLPRQARVEHARDGLDVVRLKPGRGCVIEITAIDGSAIRLLVLDQQDAGKLAQLGTDEAPLLALSDAMVTRSGDAISVISRDRSALAVSFFPPGLRIAGGNAGRTEGVFGRVDCSRAQRAITADIEKMDGQRALLKLPQEAFDGLDDIFLDVDYGGDVCRIFDAATGVMVADTMNNGTAWSVSLRRFRQALSGAGLVIRIEPMRVTGGPPKLDGEMTLKAQENTVGEKAALRSLTLHPRYVAMLSLTA